MSRPIRSLLIAHPPCPLRKSMMANRSILSAAALPLWIATMTANPICLQQGAALRRAICHYIKDGRRYHLRQRQSARRGGPQCQFTNGSAEWGFDQGDRWSTAFTTTWEKTADWPTLVVGNYVDRKNPDGPFEVCDVNELHRPAAISGSLAANISR